MNTRSLLLFAAMSLLAAPAAMATDEIAVDTDLACTACHDKAGSRLLTDKGKYFETMGSLDGYETLTNTVGRCTACHVRKPGSKRLTKTGKSFSEVVKDLEEFRQWLDEQHPKTPAGQASYPPCDEDELRLAKAH